MQGVGDTGGDTPVLHCKRQEHKGLVDLEEDGVLEQVEEKAHLDALAARKDHPSGSGVAMRSRNVAGSPWKGMKRYAPLPN